MRFPQIFFQKILTSVKFWLAYGGLRFYCPLCGGYFRKLKPFGQNPRPHAQCPRCGSLERHRLLYLYLKNKTNLFRAKTNVLHFAPEQALSDILRKHPALNYWTADRAMREASLRCDLLKLPFQDQSVDVILCVHVLEHIPEDRTAMKELCRILKPDGWALLQVPIREHPETLEDLSITDPRERLRLFGNTGHVRYYGYDYKDRLEAAGFEVHVEEYARALGPKTVARLRLPPRERIYLCRPRGR